ncbi:hypothetical protein LNTAR_08076 [Lentisphaera araneosa HTCC2155]|jgi:hypothetical protein|uniref:Lipoprotein n=1 Tax=Lentisphaera araneosa HTCC2155 TaxID=313628 RepID=A6DRY9_9BACT|nr:hypothetical protein [Lentisphaera araneosa]EDM25564.1 hypothetical protein LNTAR_08076 [Lentisphaera araneosa HTCC2155]
MKYLTLTLAALSLLIFTSCQEEKAATPAKAPVAEITLDPTLFSQKLDEGVTISEARKLKAGDQVTVNGKIMGTNTVFVDGRASFVMGDPEKLTSCDLREGDSCKSPWDVCCEDSKDITANTLSVQLADENGMVLKTGLKGKSGLKELALLTVQGTVSPQSSEQAMIINATAIQVK